MGKSTQDLYVGAPDFSASGLAQHAWEHDHHIDCGQARVESHYRSRLSRKSIYIRQQPSSLNRDRGTLADMYNFIICDLSREKGPYATPNQK